MNNNTRDDYKKAIKAKYEIEKEGEFSNHFVPTSQANLRNLCWIRFETNSSKDDSSIFFSVFDFEFDLSRSKYFAANMTDKFRPVVTFLKGEKEPAKFNRVELAAILVDFHPRPFKKFNKEGCFEVDKPVEELHIPVKNPDIPEIIFVSNETNDKAEKEYDVKNEGSIQRENLNEDGSSLHEGNLNNIAFSNTEERLAIDEILVDDSKKKDILKQVKTTAQVVKPVELFLGFKNELEEKNYRIKLSKWIKIAIISFLGIFVYYYFSQKKQCMQWSVDHYEEVSCDLEVPGIRTTGYKLI